MTWMGNRKRERGSHGRDGDERRGEKDICGWVLSNRLLISDTGDSVVPRMDVQRMSERQAVLRGPLRSRGHALMCSIPLLHHLCTPKISSLW